MIHFSDSYRIKATVFFLSITSAFSALPAKAFTLADSQGVFFFTNFSTAPFSTSSSAQTDTFTIGDNTTAIADANALFIALPNPLAVNSISNSAFTSTFPSLALAQSEASVIGNFAIAAGETFSFDFFGAIDLRTSAEQPTDFATALLDIQYSILAFEPDTETFNQLDFLTLLGEISTPTGMDSFSTDNSSAITLTLLNVLNNTSSVQTAEAISAQIAGRYERFFGRPTTLALAEAKAGAVAIETQNLKEVPTPNISIAGWGGLLGVVALRKRGWIKSWLRQKKIDIQE